MSELAEKSLLGSMLMENDLISDSGMKEVFFQSHLHRTIFRTMCELSRAGKSADYITILVSREPAEVGGASYLAELSRFGNPARFYEYKEIVVERWRELEKTRLLQRAHGDQWHIGQIVKAFDDLQQNHRPLENTSLEQDLLAQYDRPFIEQVELTGVTTGLSDMDYLLSGFQPSEFIVVAARPSMGKTDTLNHFAITAGNHGFLPIIFSLEMSRKSMIDRMIASVGCYSRLKMRNPNKLLTDAQKRQWKQALKRLTEANIHIDDRSGLKVSEIKAMARTIIKKYPHMQPILFIDYLQIIRPEQQTPNQTQAIGQISADLKTMAKELNCPVVTLSQLSRAVEQRLDKQPMMSDLRDSGNIEQDADVVCFLYRKDYYEKTTTPSDILEIQIAKQRNGPIGDIKVFYNKDTGRLRDS